MRWLKLRKMRSKDLDTRDNAFAAATRNRDIEMLLQVTEDADQYVRGDAIKALGEIGDAMAVPTLIKRIEDANFNNQEAAAAALAKIGDGRAVQPLVAMLRAAGKEQQARYAAAEALIKLGEAKAVPLLLDALQDRDAYTRAMALQVLAVIGDGRCVPAAIAALRDSDSNVRWSAVATLGALRDARAVEPLLGLLTRESWALGSETIIKALGQIGDARVVPALEALLGGRRGDTRKTAAAALDALGWQPTDDALRVHYFVAQQRWQEITQLGWERAHEPLLESLRNGDEDVRCQAVTALGLIGDRRAVEALIPALKDADARVQEETAAVLAKIGDTRAVRPLIDYCLRYSPEGGYRNDPTAPSYEQDRATRWMSPLEALISRSVTEISSADLQELLALEDKKYHLRVEYDSPGYGDGADDFMVMLDSSRVRDMATKESRRRMEP
jgi:HEAT repeat protein